MIGYQNPFMPNRQGVLKNGIYPGSGVPRGAQIGRGGLNTAGSQRKAWGGGMPTKPQGGGFTSTGPGKLRPGSDSHPAPDPMRNPRVPRPTPPPSPTYNPGYFMWDGKWYFLNNQGNFAAVKAPKNPGNVIGVPTNLPDGSKLPPALGLAARYHDWAYQRDLINPLANLAAAQQGYDLNKKNYDLNYQQGMGDLSKAFKQDLYGKNAQFAGRGISSSGIRESADVNRVKSREDALKQLDATYGGSAVADLLRALSQAKNTFSKEKSVAESAAKDRYFEEHPKAARAPSRTGRFKENGIWYYVNNNGVRVTANPPKRKGKK